ncbi:MAG: phosphopyruvate hydratase [Myxococcota bacterium]
MSAEIKDVRAREILDSRGQPTVHVDVWLEDESRGSFSVPSGASTGEHEAIELRDGDAARYFGKGVLNAVSNVNNIIRSALIGEPADDQRSVDDTLLNLDGTPNKSHLGANAILGVSMAAARAAAVSKKMPFYRYLSEGSSLSMPIPMMNILNGGAHADNGLDIQEFMMVPHGFSKFSESLRAGAEVFHKLKSILKKADLVTAVGDEGGFAPRLNSTRQALDLILEAIAQAGYQAGTQISLALDVAASEFYDASKQNYQFKDTGLVDSSRLIQFWKELTESYPILSIEDGLDQNDWAGWQSLTSTLGQQVQLVGDDLFVTNPAFIQKGISSKAANAVLIKLNQIGTLSETMSAIHMAQKAGYKHVVSHRSGETEDTSIADLAVATSAAFIKTGSLCRSERIAKYNRLLEIEEELTK